MGVLILLVVEDELEELRGHDVARKYKEEKTSNKQLKKRVTELEGQLAAADKHTARERPIASEPLDSWETIERDDSLEFEANQVESQLQQTDTPASTDNGDQEEEVSSSPSELETVVSWRGRLMGWVSEMIKCAHPEDWLIPGCYSVLIE